MMHRYVLLCGVILCGVQTLEASAGEEGRKTPELKKDVARFIATKSSTCSRDKKIKNQGRIVGIENVKKFNMQADIAIDIGSISLSKEFKIGLQLTWEDTSASLTTETIDEELIIVLRADVHSDDSWINDTFSNKEESF